MAIKYPANTRTIRSLTLRYHYFLVVKPDSLVDDIPQSEYFVYRFRVSVSEKIGVDDIKSYFKGTELEICRAMSDTEYATGIFLHPYYKNNNREPLSFAMNEIPIYNRTAIGVIDLEKDPYKYGSKPIIIDNTASILRTSNPQRANGKKIT